ncbi:SdpI family protein [Streptosporangium sp. NPDC023825]|uniref:SdpI family protein n=1 Tax=Streptosporangium sp. NPDC023825 TaxID=3154909 RepID=UPI0034166AB8
MEPVIVASVLTLPALALLLIPFHDESGAADTRNHLAGFRTRQTLASREAWNAAHTWARAPMRRLAAALGLVLAASIAAGVLLDLPEAAGYAILALQFTLLIGGLSLIGLRADRIAAEVNGRDDAPPPDPR